MSIIIAIVMRLGSVSIHMLRIIQFTLIIQIIAGNMWVADGNGKLVDQVRVSATPGRDGGLPHIVMFGDHTQK